MDDFSFFGSKAMHLSHLRNCFERCRKFKMSLNPYKCAIAVRRGVLLGHILSQERIQVDPRKIQSILNAKCPTALKTSSRFVGQIKWHTRHLRHLSDVSAPLSHLPKKGVDFLWAQAQEKSF